MLGSERHYFVLHYHVVKLIGSDSHYSLQIFVVKLWLVLAGSFIVL